MAFHLSKHHGLGNDFLVHLTDDVPAWTDRGAWVERAVRWCNRRLGIGADGLLVGLYGTGATDLQMLLVNADGSVAEMSGNGIRCLAQAEARRRGNPLDRLVIRTDGGDRTVELETLRQDPTAVIARVEMGPARPGPEPDRKVDLGGPLPDGATDALASNPRRRSTYDLGNPHLVLLVEDPGLVDLVAAGSSHEAAFSAGINVHVIAPTPGETDALTMRVWERGAGVTEACGTGAVAAARAAHDWGLVGPRVVVHMPGGDAEVVVGDPMVLHGPAVHVADLVVPR